MGIITDPGYELYIDEPAQCFYPKKTPKKLFCTVSGVKKGEMWSVAFGSTMNGSYILEWISVDVWRWMAAGQTVIANLMTDKTIHTLNNEGGWTPFVYNQNEGCRFAAPNDLQDPEGIFYGGCMTLVMREAGSPLPSIKTTCNMAGVPPAKKTFAELTNCEDCKLVIRLARQRDGTCIRVKY
ncbi:hypothetical protein ES703_40384 [subsurface metagenome]